MDPWPQDCLSTDCSGVELVFPGEGDADLLGAELREQLLLILIGEVSPCHFSNKIEAYSGNQDRYL